MIESHITTIIHIKSYDLFKMVINKRPIGYMYIAQLNNSS